MPYIKKARRDELDFGRRNDRYSPTNPGELNYVLTSEIKKYLEFAGTSYATINNVIGALEGAKLEFYRRVAAPYEDTKIKENGDVY